MFLFACPIPTPFSTDPWRWYSEHWETASNPAYVEWGRSENLVFLSIHLAWGLVVLALVVCGLVRLYISQRARMSNVEKCGLAGASLATAIFAFFFLWDGASKWNFPHVSAESQMNLLMSCYGLAMIVPSVFVGAALLILAGINKANKPVDTQVRLLREYS